MRGFIVRPVPCQRNPGVVDNVVYSEPMTKLPTKDVLQQHVTAGMTYGEIAKMYGATRQGVHIALSRSNLIRGKRKSYADRIPWRNIREEHRNSNLLVNLRRAARVERGETLTPRLKGELDTWLRGMDKPSMAAPRGWVVAYDPKMGFGKVPRQPEDEWLVRQPVTTDA